MQLLEDEPRVVLRHISCDHQVEVMSPSLKQDYIKSQFLFGHDLALIAEWADHPDTSEVLDRFEAALNAK